MTKCLKNFEKIEATLAIDASKHARDKKSVTTRCRGLLSKVDTPFKNIRTSILRYYLNRQEMLPKKEKHTKSVCIIKNFMLKLIDPANVKLFLITRIGQRTLVI